MATNRKDYQNQDFRQGAAQEDTEMYRDGDPEQGNGEESLEEWEQELNRREADLAAKDEDLQAERMKVDARRKALAEKYADFDREVEDKCKERYSSLQADKVRLQDLLKSRDEEIAAEQNKIKDFKDLERILGGRGPGEVLGEIKKHEQKITESVQALTIEQESEARKALEAKTAECEDLRKSNEELRKELAERKGKENEVFRQKADLAQLDDVNRMLSSEILNLKAYNNKLESDLRRWQASYGVDADRAERVCDIEKPLGTFLSGKPYLDDNTNEIYWLQTIRESCRNFEMKFSKRVIYAFHTALKTAEMSPVTVLAGVSGTGKSELPKLYSAFGGINFLSVPVQPNWDSTESLLGYFNSIDNRFDPTPVLRFLVQCQTDPNYETDTQPTCSLSDDMNIILLDEMNLAHVELYFAEFLSRLESRRSKSEKDNDPLPVNIGAGIEPFPLKLGRNVLWVGTMNQDETTKSLSDKVLDRGIVITFPRPKTLQRRRTIGAIPNADYRLKRKTWARWVQKQTIFSDDQIKPYKAFIEGMNESLSKVGRALGHRVWQSVEYYMSNYPDAIAAAKSGNIDALERAMKVAFEDQLVQKVMPKLRGIETRGKAADNCLKPIRAMLNQAGYEDLDEDFALACELGYGQFMWSSANYLNNTPDDDDDLPPQQNHAQGSVPRQEAPVHGRATHAKQQDEQDSAPSHRTRSHNNRQG